MQVTTLCKKYRSKSITILGPGRIGSNICMCRCNQRRVSRCLCSDSLDYRKSIIFWHKVASSPVLYYFIYSGDVIRNHRHTSFVCFYCRQTKSFFVTCDEYIFSRVQYSNNFFLIKFSMKRHCVLQSILSYQCLQHRISVHILGISDDIKLPTRILCIQGMEYFNCMMYLFVGYNSPDNRQHISLSSNFSLRNKWHICRIGNHRNIRKSACTKLICCPLRYRDGAFVLVQREDKHIVDPQK